MDERKGGLVLDPYCGSGTTLVAAKILGHNYIGIDISKEYVEFAKKRLENFKDEEPIAYEEIVKHTLFIRHLKKGNKEVNLQENMDQKRNYF